GISLSGDGTASPVPRRDRVRTSYHDSRFPLWGRATRAPPRDCGAAAPLPNRKGRGPEATTLTSRPAPRQQRLRVTVGLIFLLFLVSLDFLLPGLVSATSLQFFGNVDNGIDRAKVQIDPHVPADVGATDFTLEWWMWALPGENASDDVTCG